MRSAIPAAMMAAFFCLAGTATEATAGKIVLNHDDWTFRDTGFTNANPDTAQFALNIADYFAGGGSGNFLAYSQNIGLTGSGIANAITGAGHSWTVSTAIPFTLASLSVYDGIFLTGRPYGADFNVLVDYVNAGGSVYLGGGSGYLGSVGEAATWNVFLNAFGLGFDGDAGYNQAEGVFPLMDDFVLADGVDQLYYNNGLTVEKTETSPYTRIFGYANGYAALAVYNSEGVPEAGTLALAGTALVGLGFVARRRRRNA